MIHYLDNAATTKPIPEVIEVIEKYLKELWFNPSSLYNPSKKIHEDIESARAVVADFIGAKSNEIYFTSGGSESNCFALQGFVNGCLNKGRNCSVITTAIEHKSIMECAKHLDCDIHFVGVDKYGFVIYEELENILNSIPKENKILVSIQYANNEIGTIQDIKELSDLVHKYGGYLHTDAVQAFGNIPINVSELNIDMLSASGHKIGCPKGIGFLYANVNVPLEPIIYGSQMDGMRGGTENVPYIMAFKKAVEIKSNELGFEYYNDISNCRDYFLNKLHSEIGIKINGSILSRLPNNINVTFNQNISAESLIYMLDMCGIYISAGSACNSHSIKPSYVLKAIGLSDDEAMRTIRITLPDVISHDEIDKIVSEFKKQIKLMDILD